MSLHYFDPKIAKSVGINAAVVYQNILFWCEKNKANNKHFHDGYYWTYNSIKAWGELIPYLSTRSIRTALDKLVEADLIIIGNYNKSKYDRTNWFAAKDICHNSEAHLSEMPNETDENDKPIPDINTDNKTDIYNNRSKAAIPYDKIIEIYNSTVQHPFKKIQKATEKRKRLIRKFYSDLSSDLDKVQLYFDEFNRTAPKWMRGHGDYQPVKFEYIIKEDTVQDFREGAYD